MATTPLPACTRPLPLRTDAAQLRHGRGDALLRLASRLTERDRHVARLFHEHRVLTTPQVADVAFGSRRRAEARMRELHRLRLVERFRPLMWPGSAPYHWILDEAGAAVIAAERGLDPDQLGWRRERALAIAGSQRLTHHLGVNGFFTALLRTARDDGRCRLTTWWPERRCAREWGEFVRPDGYGVWLERGRRLPFLLEWDAGTETLPRLVEKLGGYAELASAAGRATWVLFRFPSAGREREARRAFGGSTVPIATAVVEPGRSPSDALWLPLDASDPERCRLAELSPTTDAALTGGVPIADAAAV